MRLFLIAAIPLALLLYGHGLQAPLYLDDPSVLDGARGFLRPSRPLGYFSYFLSFLFADLFAPFFHWNSWFYFRLGNLLIHVLTATVVLWLARELTGKRPAGIVAGFLFLIHPVVSEPVMYISQRFESLATLFMVASAVSYTRFRKFSGWPWRWFLPWLRYSASKRRLFCQPGSCCWSSRFLLGGGGIVDSCT